VGRYPSSYHLIRPSSIFHFRLVVPADLRHFVGVAELRYILQTGRLPRTKYLALQMDAFVQRFFHRLRQGDAMKNLSDKDIVSVHRPWPSPLEFIPVKDEKLELPLYA